MVSQRKQSILSWWLSHVFLYVDSLQMVNPEFFIKPLTHFSGCLRLLFSQGFLLGPLCFGRLCARLRLLRKTGRSWQWRNWWLDDREQGDVMGIYGHKVDSMAISANFTILPTFEKWQLWKEFIGIYWELVVGLQLGLQLNHQVPAH